MSQEETLEAMNASFVELHETFDCAICEKKIQIKISLVTTSTHS